MSVQEELDARLKAIESLQSALAALQQEHQSCLDGDEAWADKWHAKYVKERAERERLEVGIRRAREMWVLGEKGFDELLLRLLQEDE